MRNIDFLKKVLMSEDSYWLISKSTSYMDWGRMKTGKNQIIFVVIPSDVRRGLKYEDILLSDLDKLGNKEVENIFINEPFPPFQYGITLSSVYDGFPITEYVKEFLTKALQLDSDSLLDYKQLLNSEQEDERSVATDVPSSNTVDQ